MAKAARVNGRAGTSRHFGVTALWAGEVDPIQLRGNQVFFSASDVVATCTCPVLPALERARLAGELAFKPAVDPEQELVAREAALHEQKALDGLILKSRTVVSIPAATLEKAAAETVRAMVGGADVIYQGVLLDTPWLGRPDFLIKVPGDSRFGDFHYEVLDAKLARHARSQALVQGAIYSLILEKAQGVAPELN